MGMFDEKLGGLWGEIFIYMYENRVKAKAISECIVPTYSCRIVALSSENHKQMKMKSRLPCNFQDEFASLAPAENV